MSNILKNKHTGKIVIIASIEDKQTPVVVLRTGERWEKSIFLLNHVPVES